MTRRERLVLLASTIGFSMVLLDTTVVNVALGSIADDLSAGPTTLEWVANAYTLVFAGLLLSTGLAADRLGARAVFLAGLGTFAAGSVAATLAPTAAALIAAQAVLGVGAALVLRRRCRSSARSSRTPPAGSAPSASGPRARPSRSRPARCSAAS